eukprot:gene24434-10033_t
MREPSPGVEYPVEIGGSFLGTEQSRMAILRYDFKPASIDNEKPGVYTHDASSNKSSVLWTFFVRPEIEQEQFWVIGGPVEVSIYMPNNNNGELDVQLAGKFEPSRDDDLDCVAIFDGSGFRLELLSGQVKTRHIRTSTAYRGAPVAATGFNRHNCSPSPSVDELFADDSDSPTTADRLASQPPAAVPFSRIHTAAVRGKRPALPMPEYGNTREYGNGTTGTMNNGSAGGFRGSAKGPPQKVQRIEQHQGGAATPKRVPAQPVPEVQDDLDNELGAALDAAWDDDEDGGDMAGGDSSSHEAEVEADEVEEEEEEEEKDDKSPSPRIPSPAKPPAVVDQVHRHSASEPAPRQPALVPAAKPPITAGAGTGGKATDYSFGACTPTAGAGTGGKATDYRWE